MSTLTRPVRQRVPWGVLPLVLVFGLAFAVPLVNVLVTSLSPPNGANAVSGYLMTLGDPLFHELALRTFIFSVSTAVICLVLGFPTALFAARSPAWLGGTVLTVVILPMFVNTVVKAFGWTVLLGGQGPLTQILGALGFHASLQFTPAAVVLALVQSSLPFMVLVLYASLQSLDVSVEEAAASLGSNAWTVFRKVILPGSREGALLGSTLVFVMAASSFVIPAVLGGGRQNTVVGRIYDMAKGGNDSYSQASVAAVLFTVVVMAITLLGTKVVRRGSR